MCSAGGVHVPTPVYQNSEEMKKNVFWVVREQRRRVAGFILSMAAGVVDFRTSLP